MAWHFGYQTRPDDQDAQAKQADKCVTQLRAGQGAHQQAELFRIMLRLLGQRQPEYVLELEGRDDDADARSETQRDRVGHERYQSAGAQQAEQDQDQRRHEQQIQQLQAEIRTLNQTISVKQGDLTQLNKDNARLVSELGAARKATQDLESKLNRTDAKLEDANKQLQTQTTDLQQYADSAQRQASQIDELTQRLESAQSKVQDFTVSQAKLETELSVKNDMIERLMAENRRQYDAPAT